MLDCDEPNMRLVPSGFLHPCTAQTPNATSAHAPGTRGLDPPPMIVNAFRPVEVQVDVHGWFSGGPVAPVANVCDSAVWKRFAPHRPSAEIYSHVGQREAVHHVVAAGQRLVIPVHLRQANELHVWAELLNYLLRKPDGTHVVGVVEPRSARRHLALVNRTPVQGNQPPSLSAWAEVDAPLEGQCPVQNVGGSEYEPAGANLKRDARAENVRQANATHPVNCDGSSSNVRSRNSVHVSDEVADFGVR